jgi:uncharacterized protein DUF4054
MGIIVSFNYAQWTSRYPEFAGISSDAATTYFDEAQIYVRNDGGGPVKTASVQSALLNMVTAHLAALYSPQTLGTPNSSGSSPASPLVGRIASATEGSVTVAADMPDQPGTAAWWNSTKYGASFWNASKQYRTMRYLIAAQRQFDPLFPGFIP